MKIRMLEKITKVRNSLGEFMERKGISVGEPLELAEEDVFRVSVGRENTYVEAMLAVEIGDKRRVRFYPGDKLATSVLDKSDVEYAEGLFGLIERWREINCHVLDQCDVFGKYSFVKKAVYR